MSSQQELLKRLDETTDIDDIEKINSMLFVNYRIVLDLIKEFLNNGLLKIEKSNNKNEYYVHLLNNGIDITRVLIKTTDISIKHKRKNIISIIKPIFHQDLKQIYNYDKNNIQVWTRNDIFKSYYIK